VARERSQGILGFVGLVAVCTVLGYGAWRALTRPKPRDGPAVSRPGATGPDSVGFLSVAGEGVELEVVAPGGSRVSTTGGEGQGKIARSESAVDCPGFAAPGGNAASCTVSINLDTPPPGDYTVVARSTDRRAVVLNVGWASATQARKGAFDVRVQVAARGATSFVIIVTREGVSQRSEPRPSAR
jgi:hypothetical protein